MISFIYQFFSCSSISHTWDAFQLAHASFRLFCVRNNYVLPFNAQQKASGKLGPRLSGDAPKINIPKEVGTDEKEDMETPDAFPAIKVYNDNVDVRFLICGLPCTLVSNNIFEMAPFFVLHNELVLTAELTFSLI